VDTVVVWGCFAQGGILCDNLKAELYNIIKVFKTSNGFAAIRSDGYAFIWGNPNFIGDEEYICVEKIKQIHCLGRKGFIYVHGDEHLLDSCSEMLDQQVIIPDEIPSDHIGNITEIYRNLHNCAAFDDLSSSQYIALKNDRSIITFGNFFFRREDLSDDEIMDRVLFRSYQNLLKHGVKKIVPLRGAGFLILLFNGQVFMIGKDDDYIHPEQSVCDESGVKILNNVRDLYIVGNINVALRDDSTIIWGSDTYSPEISHELYTILSDL
jgi:hypothetical protein